MRRANRDSFVSFHQSFDEVRYARFEYSRLRDKSCFTVVSGAVIGDTVYSFDNDAIPLKRNVVIRVDETMKQKLRAAAIAYAITGGTKQMDCSRFAFCYAGFKQDMIDNFDERIALTSIDTWQTSIAGQIVRFQYPDWYDEEQIEEGEHWAVCLDEQGEQFLHVAGVAGPLMLSSAATVSAIYPNRLPYIASAA